MGASVGRAESGVRQDCDMGRYTLRHGESDHVLQDHLPDAPWTDAVAWRLPGIRPIEPDGWLTRDEAFAGQMKLRDRLIATREAEVHALLPEALRAAEECLETVLASLHCDAGYAIGADMVRRPDGVTVPLDRAAPLLTLGRLVQADFCLMEHHAGAHALTGAILCFPAHWTLAEKIGKPLGRIHTPVPQYDADIARRVDRLFDAIRPERALWRANAHLYRDSDLFTPQREADPPRRCLPSEARYVRSERQALRRLPHTGAVVFTIHTRMVAIETLTEGQRASLEVLDQSQSPKVNAPG